MALTDTGIRALKPRDGRYIVTDGRGLSLEVLPSGKMAWLYRYRLDGKYGKVSLGRYPDLSLKKAREKRDELAGKVAKGESPAEERKLARAGMPSNPTVKEFAERYYKEQVVKQVERPEKRSALPG